MRRHRYLYCKKQKYKCCSRHKCAITKQRCYLGYIAYCMPEITFFERIFRLVICGAEFLNISLYIRSIFNKPKKRKNIVDFYVILTSIIYPILVLVFRLEKCFTFAVIAKYLILTSLIYLLGVVFLDDVYEQPYSKKRSLLLVFINYIGITLYFSILYQYFNAIKGVCGKTVSNLEAVYFSFVTSTTLGFGDFKPINNTGQILVIIQVCIFLLFIVVFFNHFMNLKQKE